MHSDPRSDQKKTIQIKVDKRFNHEWFVTKLLIFTLWFPHEHFGDQRVKWKPIKDDVRHLYDTKLWNSWYEKKPGQLYIAFVQSFAETCFRYSLVL